MENVRIQIEAWGGHISPEQLEKAILTTIQHLSSASSINCTVDGISKTTAIDTSVLLSKESELNLSEYKVNRYGALSVKLIP